MFEIQKNITLTLILLLFSGITFAYRYWDVFFKFYGNRGKIYFGWTLHLLGFIHTAIGVATISEYFLLRENYNCFIGVIAFSIFLLGQIIRNQAIKSLGIYHSPHIEIKPNHKLIIAPPYCFLRHPYYLGVMLEVLATPLVLNSYFTFLGVVVSYLPVLWMRIILEEKVMNQHFGLTYTKYQKQTFRFIPLFHRLISSSSKDAK